MSMTRKDFEGMAKAIRSSRPENPLSGGHTIADRIAEEIATVCAKSNPQFDRTRFLRACGVEE